MSEKRKSLILLTVDCLRSDHCGFYGYSPPTTPFLDTLAAESMVVPTAVVAGAPTYYSLPAILASRMPLALGRDVIGLAPGEVTLASALRNAGYATAAFSAANPYISARFGYQQGFEVFQDFLDLECAPASVETPRNREAQTTPNGIGRLNRSLRGAARALGLGAFYDELYFQYCLKIASPPAQSIDALRRFPSAEAIVDRALAWLKTEARKPFFLWLHLMDPHSPYYPTASAYRELTGKEISAAHARYLNEFWNRSDLGPMRLAKKKDAVIDLYDAGIRSADDQMARLVSRLRENDLWESCTFALTADHGEEFLDHGGRYHAPLGLYDEIARVPLMIRVPGIAKKPIASTPFSHLHLAPTLLDILDIEPPRTFEGRTLLSNLLEGSPWDAPAIAECVYGCTNPLRAKDRMGERLLSIRSAENKMVMRIAAGTTEQVYDLDADPEELRPLAGGTHKEVRQQFLRTAMTHLKNNSNAARAEFRLKARLRNLRSQLQSKSL